MLIDVSQKLLKNIKTSITKVKQIDEQKVKVKMKDLNLLEANVQNHKRKIICWNVSLVEML